MVFIGGEEKLMKSVIDWDIFGDKGKSSSLSAQSTSFPSQLTLSLPIPLPLSISPPTLLSLFPTFINNNVKATIQITPKESSQNIEKKIDDVKSWHRLYLSKHATMTTIKSQVCKFNLFSLNILWYIWVHFTIIHRLYCYCYGCLISHFLFKVCMYIFCIFQIHLLRNNLRKVKCLCFWWGKMKQIISQTMNTIQTIQFQIFWVAIASCILCEK